MRIPVILIEDDVVKILNPDNTLIQAAKRFELGWDDGCEFDLLCEDKFPMLYDEGREYSSVRVENDSIILERI